MSWQRQNREKNCWCNFCCSYFRVFVAKPSKRGDRRPKKAETIFLFCFFFLIALIEYPAALCILIDIGAPSFHLVRDGVTLMPWQTHVPVLLPALCISAVTSVQYAASKSPTRFLQYASSATQSIRGWGGAATTFPCQLWFLLTKWKEKKKR